MTRPQQPLGGGRRVTISDVAAELGLTKGTVSRALNDYPDISEGTRLRARRAAERLGYRPMGSAQAIRTGRCRAIGLVLETDEHDAHRPFLDLFLAGLSDGAAAEGWTLTVATAPVGAARETYQRLIDERKADGFVLPRTKLEDPRVELLRGSDVPFVLFGGHKTTEGCAWFDIDGADAMRQTAHILKDRGHTRIAYVGGSPDYAYNGQRQGGLEAGLAECDLALDPTLVRHGANNRAIGEAVTAELLDLPEPPTAIVFAVDRAALGAWRPAEARGLAVGRDLAVIAYDGDPEGAFTEPPLATWSVDWGQAGTILARMLIQRVLGAPVEDLRATMPAQFLDRGTASAVIPPDLLEREAGKPSHKGGDS
ncbi:MAG: substrate-binding domain-containing protein [Pseudomonadota bacterium]